MMDNIIHTKISTSHVWYDFYNVQIPAASALNILKWHKNAVWNAQYVSICYLSVDFSTPSGEKGVDWAGGAGTETTDGCGERGRCCHDSTWGIYQRTRETGEVKQWKLVVLLYKKTMNLQHFLK